jgi:hypothetical protein
MDVVPVTAFFVAFLATLLAELGDKTQLVTLTLSCRYKPLRVLAGALTALAVITGVAVILGDYLAVLLPVNTTDRHRPHSCLRQPAGCFFGLYGRPVYQPQRGLFPGSPLFFPPACRLS